jgi:PAS domain S-box-containing protein
MVEASPRAGDAPGLEAQARLLRALFDHLPAMVAYWDHDLRNVVANAAYLEWFGFTPERMLGMHIREVLGERVYAMNLPYIEGALAGEEQLFDRTLVDTSGRTRHTQASYVPDVVDGEVRGFFVLVTDVTPRVEAQRAMDEAQSLAALGSWSMDVETGTIAWSPELYRIFGVDEAVFEPTFASLMAMVHPDDVTRVQRARDDAMESGEPYAVAYRICRPDGRVREVQSRGRPVLDASGSRVLRLTGSIQDVTEANAAARELARLNTELIQLNELSADVLGMLGHDVRGPLTVVLGYLEELDEEWDGTSEARRRQHVATARGAATRLRTLVDDILAMASVESGSIEAETSDHDLAHLVEDALGEVPGHAEIALEGDRSLRVWCDAFHVRQIVANLVGNAVRYGEPPIVVSLQAGDDTAAISVTDHGQGVPAEFVPHLFDRFSRGPGERNVAGSGLGLYIASRLAEANNGTLSYEAGPGRRGAVFTLVLPRVG